MKQFYRKKPVTVEAFLYDGRYTQALVEFMRECKWHYTNYIGRPNYVIIETLEGTMIADPGDYIIKGVQNEYYPCKPEIFHLTYERVNK